MPKPQHAASSRKRCVHGARRPGPHLRDRQATGLAEANRKRVSRQSGFLAFLVCVCVCMYVRVCVHVYVYVFL